MKNDEALKKKISIKKNEYMTTGEFARMMGVTKNTLFHYDKIGLFSPEIVLSNEYRYYSIYQAELFDCILFFKDTGMTLQEIKQLLSERSPSKMKEVFALRQQQIDKEIRKLRQQKEWIQTRSKQIDEIQSTVWTNIYIKEFPTRYYLYAPVEGTEDSQYILRSTEIISDFRKKNADIDYDIGYIQQKSDIEQGIFDKYGNVLLITQKRPRNLPYHTFERGHYLCAYHKGYNSSIFKCYQRLLDYAAANHLKLDSVFLEYFLVDLLFVHHEEDYIIEVSIKICNS